MLEKSRKIAAATAGAGALMLASIAPAVADSARYNQCESYPWAEFEVCFDIHEAYNTTETPSGNSKFNSNTKYTITYNYYSGETYTFEGSNHINQLYKKGEPHVYHGRGSETSTFNGQTCTYTWAYHFNNGEWRYNDFDVECSEVS